MPTPSVAGVTNFIRVKLNIEYKDGSWTEVYNTKFQDFSGCIAIWSNILSYRTMLLPWGFTLARATMSMAGQPGVSRQLVPGMWYSGVSPVYWTGGALDSEVNFGSGAPGSVVGACNDPEACILIRLDTGQGPFCNHWLRGVRDSWVQDDLLILPSALPTPDIAWTGNPVTSYYPAGGAPVGGNPGNYTVPGTYLSWNGAAPVPSSVALLNAFFSCLRDFTSIYQPIPQSAPRAWNRFDFNTSPNGNWYYRRISSREEGIRYHFSRGKRPAYA